MFVFRKLGPCCRERVLHYPQSLISAVCGTKKSEVN